MASVAEVNKTQRVRAVDVIILGPFMSWYALQPGPLPKWARLIMFLSGLGTIVYNQANYRAQADLLNG